MSQLLFSYCAPARSFLIVVSHSCTNATTTLIHSFVVTHVTAVSSSLASRLCGWVVWSGPCRAVRLIGRIPQLGVPTGSVLGPILYVLFTADLPSVLANSVVPIQGA